MGSSIRELSFANVLVESRNGISILNTGNIDLNGVTIPLTESSK